MLNKFIISILLLLATSCQHIKLEEAVNDVTKTVSYKDRKYLIPVPENYCIYDKNRNFDKATLNLQSSSMSASFSENIIAIYEDCDEKKKLENNEIYDAPRSLMITSYDKGVYGYSTRSRIIEVTYKYITSLSKAIKKRKPYAEKAPEEMLLAEKELVKYGFSDSRSKIIAKRQEDIRRSQNIQLREYKDDYAAYHLSFEGNDEISYYHVRAYTKLYGKVTSIALTRALEPGDFNSRIAKKVLNEAKKYVRKFVEINDEKDYRKYSYGDKNVRIYTPKGFLFVEKESKKIIKQKYSKPKVTKNLDYKEAMFRFNVKNKYKSELIISILKIDPERFVRVIPGSFLDSTYDHLKSSNVNNTNLLHMYREDEGVMTITKVGKSVGFTYITVINGVPITLLCQIYDPDKVITENSIQKSRQELIKYANFLYENQETDLSFSSFLGKKIQ